MQSNQTQSGGAERTSAIATFLKTRRGMLVTAAILLAAALVWPTPWGNSQGKTASTALYVIANWARPERFAAPVYSFLSRSWVFGVASLTNLVFLVGFGMRNTPNPSRTLQGLLLAAVVVDLATAWVLRDLARMPGYWLWVAAVTAVMWAFVARPATGQAPRGYLKAQLLARPGRETRTGLPALIWVWMGWFAFWALISGLSHWVEPERADAAAAPRAVKAAALTGYVNDFAGLLRSDAVESLGASLTRFEKETSIQIAVAIYPRLPDIAVEQFTIRVAELSRLGRKGLDNGAILSIFASSNAARLEIGYGLEGVLTDAQTHRILESVLAPAWAAGDHEKAVDQTLAAITGAVRDAYRAGKMPGRMAVFWRQLTVETPKFVKGVPPTLVALPTDARVGISFFGSFLLLGIADGFLQTQRLLHNARVAVRNLCKGIAISKGTESIRFDSIFDTLKVLLFVGFVAYCLVGVVVVAGGGAFGGAGSMLRW
jgi:uncharacterized membrane protein YgcG